MMEEKVDPTYNKSKWLVELPFIFKFIIMNS